MEFETNKEHIVQMVVLEPEVIDKQGHIVSADEIEEGKAFWESESKTIGIQHFNQKGDLFGLTDFDPSDECWQFGYEDDSFEIISSVIAPDDMTIGNQNQRVKQGSWVLTLRVLDKDIWQKIQNEELTGCSIGANAILDSENSHSRIYNLIPLEVSLCAKPANNRTFLTKALEALRNPISGWHNCRLKSPESFQEGSFRTMEQTTSDGRKVNIIIGRPVGSSKTAAQAIRYPVESFTEAEAKQSCKEKSGTFEPAKEE